MSEFEIGEFIMEGLWTIILQKHPEEKEEKEEKEGRQVRNIEEEEE